MRGSGGLPSDHEATQHRPDDRVRFSPISAVTPNATATTATAPTARRVKNTVAKSSRLIARTNRDTGHTHIAPSFPSPWNHALDSPGQRFVALTELENRHGDTRGRSQVGVFGRRSTWRARMDRLHTRSCVFLRQLALLKTHHWVSMCLLVVAVVFLTAAILVSVLAFETRNLTVVESQFQLPKLSGNAEKTTKDYRRITSQGKSRNRKQQHDEDMQEGRNFWQSSRCQLGALGPVLDPTLRPVLDTVSLLRTWDGLLSSWLSSWLPTGVSSSSFAPFVLCDSPSSEMSSSPFLSSSAPSPSQVSLPQDVSSSVRCSMILGLSDMLFRLYYCSLTPGTYPASAVWPPPSLSSQMKRPTTVAASADGMIDEQISIDAVRGRMQTIRNQFGRRLSSARGRDDTIEDASQRTVPLEAQTMYDAFCTAPRRVRGRRRIALQYLRQTVSRCGRASSGLTVSSSGTMAAGGMQADMGVNDEHGAVEGNDMTSVALEVPGAPGVRTLIHFTRRRPSTRSDPADVATAETAFPKKAKHGSTDGRTARLYLPPGDGHHHRHHPGSARAGDSDSHTRSSTFRAARTLSAAEDMDFVYTYVNGSEPNRLFRRAIWKHCALPLQTLEVLWHRYDRRRGNVDHDNSADAAVEHTERQRSELRLLSILFQHNGNHHAEEVIRRSVLADVFAVSTTWPQCQPIIEGILQSDAAAAAADEEEGDGDAAQTRLRITNAQLMRILSGESDSKATKERADETATLVADLTTTATIHADPTAVANKNGSGEALSIHTIDHRKSFSGWRALAPDSTDSDADELRYSLRSVFTHTRHWHRGRYILVLPGPQVPRWLDLATNFMRCDGRLREEGGVRASVVARRHRREQQDRFLHRRTICREASRTSTAASAASTEAAFPRLRVLDQSALLPEGLRLTADSFVIESHLYKVRGLTDLFVYLNDDYFFRSRVTPGDFVNGIGGAVIRLEDNFPDREDLSTEVATTVRATDAGAKTETVESIVESDETTDRRRFRFNWKTGALHTLILNMEALDIGTRIIATDETPSSVVDAAVGDATEGTARGHTKVEYRFKSLYDDQMPLSLAAAWSHAGTASAASTLARVASVVAASTAESMAAHACPSAQEKLRPPSQELPTTKLEEASTQLTSNVGGLPETGSRSSRYRAKERSSMMTSFRLFENALSHSAMPRMFDSNTYVMQTRVRQRYRRRYEMHAPFVVCRNMMAYLYARLDGFGISANSLQRPYHKEGNENRHRMNHDDDVGDETRVGIRSQVRSDHGPQFPLGQRVTDPYTAGALTWRAWSHRERNSSDLYFPFMYTDHMLRQPWAASPAYAAYLAAKTLSAFTAAPPSSRGGRSGTLPRQPAATSSLLEPSLPLSITVSLDNHDGCAPPTLLVGERATRTVYAQLSDDPVANNATMARLKSAGDGLLFTNLNSKYTLPHVAAEMRAWLASEYPEPLPIERPTVGRLEREENTHARVRNREHEERRRKPLKEDAYPLVPPSREWFHALMRAPLVLIADRSAGLCPLLRSLQLALPAYGNSNDSGNRAYSTHTFPRIALVVAPRKGSSTLKEGCAKNVSHSSGDAAQGRSDRDRKRKESQHQQRNGIVDAEPACGKDRASSVFPLLRHFAPVTTCTFASPNAKGPVWHHIYHSSESETESSNQAKHNRLHDDENGKDSDDNREVSVDVATLVTEVLAAWPASLFSSSVKPIIPHWPFGLHNPLNTSRSPSTQRSLKLPTSVPIPIHALVIDARTHSEQTIAIPGELLSLEDFVAVGLHATENSSMFRKSSKSPSSIALVTTAVPRGVKSGEKTAHKPNPLSRGAGRSLTTRHVEYSPSAHWVFGESEKSLLGLYPLPYLRFEDGEASVQWLW